jgi:FkbM family methyltransferase
VDVGSGMGLTALAVMQMYPMTKIVSIEPASPNWLLQELNLRCNLPKKELSKIKVLLAGVGPNDEDEDNMMAKLMWRPTSTTSTRSWTPADEFGPDDIELLVRLRKLKSILAEADVYRLTPNMMDVLNLDCQGCEYNLVPALAEGEFESIPNIIGGVHWGYIPVSKLPSSDRGRRTHERLCQHENIAKATKECCSFLDSPVKSSVPGEVLYREKGDGKPAESVTVSDIIQDGLCLDFDQWAKDHYVHDIQDDFGWFELSSQA